MGQSALGHGGAMVSLGKRTFTASTELPGGSASFELDVFLAYEDSSRLLIEYNEVVLQEGWERSDYYGFGSSAQEVLSDTTELRRKLEGCNASVSIVTTLKRRACYPAAEDPFYFGDQSIFYIPYTWRHEDAACEDAESEYVVWKDGARTDAALELYDEVRGLSELDAAPNRKGGELRTIANGKRFVSRDAFLTPSTHSSTTEPEGDGT